jgi:hypothetical protein
MSKKNAPRYTGNDEGGYHGVSRIGSYPCFAIR